MYTIGKKNKLGKKTFWYFFITRNFFGLILTLLTLYLAYEIYYGVLSKYVKDLLLSNVSYVSTSMVSSWLLMLTGSLLIILLARTSVLYKQYSFVLHNHALHITHGIFFVKEQIIPYPQITNVEIVSPYIYSLFGLVQLNVETGQTEDRGNKKNEKTRDLPPMDKVSATKLAHELMRRAALQNGYQVDSKSLQGGISSQKKRRRR
jgi:uncharacterized membrane protein YdbT with pleckstrin-like domain